MESILSAINDPAHREIYIEFIEILLKQYALQATPVFTVAALDPVMDYTSVETMAFQLTLQLQALEARGFTLLFWQPQDIVKAYSVEHDNSKEKQELYVLANLAQRVPLQKKDVMQLVLVYPTVFPLPSELCAPELRKIPGLPFITPRSASYYSLALVCLHQINLSLDNLQGTKLFYFLERCLSEDPNERLLLYI